MSLVITLTVERGNPPTYHDADTTPVLRNAEGTAGVIYNATGAVVVPAGQQFVRDDVGRYSYTLANAAVGAYTAYRRVTLDGSTQTATKTYYASPLSVLPVYLPLSEADAYSAGLPLLTSYAATTDANARVALLALATMRVDRSRRWQGGKTSPDQALEFPRGGSMVVPQDVKLAVLYEANSIADGTRDRIAASISAGLTGQSTGSVSEQYRQFIAGQSGVQTLCPEAEQLVCRYRLTSGRLL